MSTSRLHAYAATAAAAAVAPLAAGSTYTVVDLVTPMDLNGSMGINLSDVPDHAFAYLYWNFNAAGDGGNGVLTGGSLGWPGGLADSAMGGYLVGYSVDINNFEDWGSNTGTGFNPTGKSYIGIRIAVGSDYRYGWIEFLGAGAAAQVTRWAYSDTLNTTIATAPANSSPAVPGLGGLAALACGAAGVRRSRTRVA